MYPEPPAIPWPYDDEAKPPASRSWYRRPEVIVTSALSVLAVAALIIALVIVSNPGERPGNSTESATQTVYTAAPPPPTVPPEEAPRQPADQTRLDPASYESIGTREFALLVKNPDAEKGRKVIVHGVVTQFDAATGSSAFRANTAAAPQASPYDYEQNTIVEARDPDILTNVVQDDMVTMYVEVRGSTTYETTLGGSMTVPMFVVNIIEVASPTARTVPTPAPYTPAPIPVDSESASLSQLRTIANEDGSFVAAQLADRWVPQLSSKRSGLIAEGLTWNNSTILQEHLQLRQQFPGARLLWSGDWSTFSASNFWITIAGISFPDADGALAWCTSQGRDRDHCFAKIVSTTHSVDGSTAYN